MSTTDRALTMSWEDLAEVLRKSGRILGEEEHIHNITLTKPKQMVLRLTRAGKVAGNVSK